MSLKASLDVWVNALKAYDAEDFEKSLEMFSRIADESKILVNMGLIYATLGEHEAAVEKFIEATGFDQYLAVAYFQCGVSNFLLANYDLALKDFEEALLYLRGNQAINYEQLGLKFRLFSAEVLFNKGLTHIYLGNARDGLADMEDARRDKATDEHNVIDDAIADQGEGYTVFSIPVGVLYRPSEKKVRNLEAKDYMGKAKLVAAADSNDAFTTFTGVTRIKQGITPSGSYVESDGPMGLGRSKTEPAAAPSSSTPAPRATNLSRSQTTINVASNARELTNPAAPREAPARSNTITPANRAAPGQGIGGPVRGLSVRKVNAAPPPAPVAPAAAPPPPAPAKDSDNRMTEFYDSYLNSYAEDTAPPPVPAPAPAAGDRVAAWARNNANPNNQAPNRVTKSAPSSYAPSSFGGGGSMRRRLTRRGTSSRAQSRYVEEEEGYVSGEYEDDGPFELIRIRVKIHYADDLRGMTLAPEVPFEEFMDKVTSKFGKSINGLLLKFKDEDGGMVSLRDESDYDMAIETAREHSKGMPEGKLEIWCTDV